MFIPLKAGSTSVSKTHRLPKELGFNESSLPRPFALLIRGTCSLDGEIILTAENGSIRE
jgi:hypothetical protein